MGEAGRQLAELLVQPRAFQVLTQLPEEVGRRLWVKIQDLRQFPESGAPIPHPRYQGWRRLIVPVGRKRYQIGYQYNSTTNVVRVMRIVYPGEDWPPRMEG